MGNLIGTIPFLGLERSKKKKKRKKNPRPLSRGSRNTRNVINVAQLRAIAWTGRIVKQSEVVVRAYSNLDKATVITRESILRHGDRG